MVNQRRELGGTFCGGGCPPLSIVVWPNPCVGIVGVNRKVCLMCLRLGWVLIDWVLSVQHVVAYDYVIAWIGIEIRSLCLLMCSRHSRHTQVTVHQLADINL